MKAPAVSVPCKGLPPGSQPGRLPAMLSDRGVNGPLWGMPFTKALTPLRGLKG